MTLRRALSVIAAASLVVIVPGGIPFAIGVWAWRRWKTTNNVTQRQTKYRTKSGYVLTVVK